MRPRELALLPPLLLGRYDPQLDPFLSLSGRPDPNSRVRFLRKRLKLSLPSRLVQSKVQRWPRRHQPQALII